MKSSSGTANRSVIMHVGSTAFAKSPNRRADKFITSSTLNVVKSLFLNFCAVCTEFVRRLAGWSIEIVPPSFNAAAARGKKSGPRLPYDIDQSFLCAHSSAGDVAV